MLLSGYVNDEPQRVEGQSSFLTTVHAQTLQRPDAPLHVFQDKIKPLIFSPIFLNFPFLDHFPLPMRKRARELAQDFHSELCSTVLRGHQHSHDDLSNAPLGCRLVGARESNALTETQFRHNMTSAFLAGHENPQLLLVSFLFLLGENQVSSISPPGLMNGVKLMISNPGMAETRARGGGGTR